jgi:GxxExxY protein
MSEKEELNQLTQKIIGAVIEVHRNLGPGMLESANEACVVFELAERGSRCERQKPLPLVYKNVNLDCGYRLDILVDGKVVVEIKAIEKVLPIHKAQLLSYLKLTGSKVGLLINFNTKKLIDGVVRVANNFPD